MTHQSTRATTNQGIFDFGLMYGLCVVGLLAFALTYVNLAASAIDIGLNFRASSGYVTDGADETYVMVTSHAYPITRAGWTFGWSAQNGFQAHADRDSSLDRRLAGTNVQTQGTFRIDLPSAGTYDFHLAMGDNASAYPSADIVVKDTTTTVLTRSHNTTTGAWFDATGNSYSAASWPTSETAVSLVFATTICNIEIGDGTNYAPISHLRLVRTAGGAPPQGRIIGGGIF